jgi:hypothetical protein
MFCNSHGSANRIRSDGGRQKSTEESETGFSFVTSGLTRPDRQYTVSVPTVLKAKMKIKNRLPPDQGPSRPRPLTFEGQLPPGPSPGAPEWSGVETRINISPQVLVDPFLLSSPAPLRCSVLL